MAMMSRMTSYAAYSREYAAPHAASCRGVYVAVQLN